MSEWEELSSVACALSRISAGEALGKLGWKKPTLFVSKEFVGLGHVIAEDFDMNLEVFEPEGYVSWYIEWNGRKVGSVGA